jgi:hypothetical protein
MDLSKALLGLARHLTPPADQDWLDALAAELPALGGRRERLGWIGGVVGVVGASWWRQAAAGLLFYAGVALAAVALTYLDLQSGSRSPYFALLIATSAALAFLRPALPWRWAVLLSFVLPLAAMLSFDGPYAHDSGDTTFPLWPSLAAAFFAAWVRSRIDSRRAGRPKPA